MRKYFYLMAATIVTFISFSFTYHDADRRNPVVQGVVIDAATGKPLAATHVYIVHGEEEALTNAKGQFSIETATRFPLTLTAYHEGYVKFETTVVSEKQRQVIRLKHK